jgi:transcriptional regulator with XRE-family HTH domain
MEIQQEELRRRLRAALELRGVKLAQLAEMVHPDSRLGERTLRKLYSGESVLTPPILRELAATLDVSYAWFTVPDLAHAVQGEGVEDRIAALEAAIAALLPAPAARGRGPRFVGPEGEGGSDAEAPANPRRGSRATQR